MRIIDSLDNCIDISPNVLSLGNFDGFHMGHRCLAEKTVEIARANGLKSAVFTFQVHPRNILGKKNSVRHIMYPADKLAVLEAMGIDYIFALPFEDLRHMPAHTFIAELIAKKLNAKHLICGFNFRFGDQATGDAELLTSLSERYDYKLHLISPVTVDGELVSSTNIRKYIQAGEMEHASRLLGRNFIIKGEVIHGNALGRTIGFPTANIILDSTMVAPAHGVYITEVLLDGKIYQSVTNVGVRPTIGDKAKLVESHILGFDEDIYGKVLSVEFIRHVRGEIRFTSIEKLAEQIVLDKQAAELYFSRKR